MKESHHLGAHPVSIAVSSVSSKDPTTALVGGIDNDRGNSSNDQEDNDETSISNV